MDAVYRAKATAHTFSTRGWDGCRTFSNLSQPQISNEVLNIILILFTLRDPIVYTPIVLVNQYQFSHMLYRNRAHFNLFVK